MRKTAGPLHFRSLISAALLIAALLTLASVVWSTLRFHISPMPSSPRARRAILSWIPADTTGEIFELGAGWGSLAIPIARQCAHAHVVACEGSPVPYRWLRSRHPLTRHGVGARLRSGLRGRDHRPIAYPLSV